LEIIFQSFNKIDTGFNSGIHYDLDSLPHYSSENPHKQNLTESLLQINENTASILESKSYFEEEKPYVIIHEYGDAVQSYMWNRINELWERRIVHI
jgi:hypothetical protein